MLLITVAVYFTGNILLMFVRYSPNSLETFVDPSMCLTLAGLWTLITCAGHTTVIANSAATVKNGVLQCSLYNTLITSCKRRKTQLCKHAPALLGFQLEKLLQEVQKVSPGVGEQEPMLQEHLLSKCALFVCNKWDQVPPEEKETVKNYVTEKLQKILPGIDLESQIICISTKNATKVQTRGYITEDFCSLMDGMKSVVLKSIEFRLEFHWRYAMCFCL